MSMHTLYGRGAVALTDDRNTYRAVNGRLDVPDHLRARALALGFTTHPLPGTEEPTVEAQPAEQSIGIGGHPQAALSAATEAKNVKQIEAALASTAPSVGTAGKRR